MRALTRPFRHSPQLAAETVAKLEDIRAAFAWAQRMRRECERWQRSDRVVDGTALRLIAERLERERSPDRPGDAG